MAIGQQIKGLAQRARRYWDDLTDAGRRRAQASREDAVHQRYGGVRRQDEQSMGQRLREHLETSQDRGTPDAVTANPAARAARSGQGNPGGQSRPDHPAQAGTPRTPAGRAAATGVPGAGSGQAPRQYAQEGGSTLPKSPGAQPGADEGGAAPGAGRSQGRPGQRG